MGRRAGPSLGGRPCASGRERARRSSKEMALAGLNARISFTGPFNLANVPAISVPCGFTESGLPLGLQLVGKPFDEETLFRAAHAYEQATTWHTRRPPI